MTDTPQPAQWLDLKTLTVIGPLFSSALAVLYDVGFFAGINIDYFTFFTFSEHMLFALQAIPLAAFAAYTVSGFFIGSWFGHKGIRKFIAKLEAEPDLERRRVIAEPFLSRAEKFNKKRNYIAVALLLPSALAIFIGSYLTAVGTLTAALFIWKGDYWEALFDPDNRRTVGFFGALAILFVAFLTGYERAGSILKTQTAAENITVNEKITPARVIRAGDRGVLFLSLENRKLQFIRWDTIKNIETL